MAKECCFGSRGVLPVSIGDLRARDAQFSALSTRHFSSLLVNDKCAHVWKGSPDGYDTALDVARRHDLAQLVEKANNGRLGRPVEVLHPGIRGARSPCRRDCSRERLPDKETVAKFGETDLCEKAFHIEQN